MPQMIYSVNEQSYLEDSVEFAGHEYEQQTAMTSETRWAHTIMTQRKTYVRHCHPNSLPHRLAI
ncbi:hypothetical protein KIN20_000486 [Parelaphostrongylus tenuis]|uniref:Uncharacterized protein n=1 Tax=Parelaphostrongylus tenuis TaxID=148309 RepID=A0AAD5LUT4_PARTN|nr:hypothetical protein KIN20_000486 [Parelaphostrongylus tenuis]